MSDCYSEAALRHSAGADILATQNQWDAAGYLIGFAVECAIKYAIVSTRTTGRVPQIPQVHLPQLVEGAKRCLAGRNSTSMFLILNQEGFMQNWVVGLRYKGNGAVSAEVFGDWRASATRALAAAGLRRPR